MRRLIPHFLLAVMTLLAAVTVVVSLHDAERISYFSAAAKGDPSLVAIFHTVVQRTLDEPSFSVDGVVDYQSPDLFRVDGGSPPTPYLVEAAHELYFRIGGQTSTPLWGRVRLAPNVATSLRPEVVLKLLTTLLHADSVVRDGNSNFTVRTVVNASTFNGIDAGQVLETMTVDVSDDLITSVATQLRGWMTLPILTVSPPNRRVRVSSYNDGVSSYGNYGHVAHISAPPTSQTLPVIVCDNGNGFKIKSQDRCSGF